jgi:hypothetical protein
MTGQPGPFGDRFIVDHGKARGWVKSLNMRGEDGNDVGETIRVSGSSIVMRIFVVRIARLSGPASSLVLYEPRSVVRALGRGRNVVVPCCPAGDER